MGLLHFFKVNFFNTQGHPIETPDEWETVAIHIEGVNIEKWDQYNLQINFRQQELYLRKINGEKKLVTDYMRLSAGHYKLTLRYQNKISDHRFTVIPKKINRIQFNIMLEDLAYGLPADIMLTLNNLGAYTGVDLVSSEKVTIAQEVLRLKRTWYGTDKKIGLSTILKRISEQPYHVLQTTETWVRNEEVRRINTSRLAQSILKNHNLNSSGKPIKVIENRAFHSYNVYENQLVKLFIHQFNMKLLNMVKFFRITNNEKLLLVCEEMSRNVRSTMHKCSFLEEVELPVNFHFKTTMVLLNIPIYQVAMKGFLEFQRTITTNINQDDIDSPIENIPFLYQKWCTLNVFSILLRVAHETGYTVKSQRLDTKVMGGKTIKILPDGRAAIVLFHPTYKITVKVIPERSYTHNGNPFRSISFTQRPDISIEVSKPNGDKKIYLFDPKYKLESEESPEFVENRKPKKVDIDKMHAYRDAIRNQRGEKVVEYAAILYPGETVMYEQGLHAISSIPGNGVEEDNIIKNVILEALIPF